MSRAAESVIGAVVAAAGRAVGAVQTALGLQPRERPLTAAETALLRRVYRGSVDLSRVRIVAGRAGLFSLSGRPFTLGDRIYLKGFDPAARVDVLVHECCHVWQHQREGISYIGGAILAQLGKGRGAYDWQAERRAAKAWPQFNREAQAQLVQDLFRDGGRAGRTGDGAFFDEEPLGQDVSFIVRGEDLTAFARASIEHVRAG
ncbi:MAG TPA: hypothetical protein VGD66_07765 [Allosphingosinicella sp.]|jgi:hypothetical protein